jgi:hypothetical protein
LEAFLKKTIPTCRIRRYVVFTSADVDFGELENLSVDGVYLMRNWDPEEMLKEGAAALTVREAGLIVAQIARDHRYHEERRRRPHP